LEKRQQADDRVDRILKKRQRELVEDIMNESFELPQQNELVSLSHNDAAVQTDQDLGDH
jgi:hypothetical protein